ncbi:penicillin-binding protein 1A [Capnocytophaga haemolytica]|uniref:Penicillin-binding protein n=2 Tax=Capnocytophaga haemolytica TaxID=45243 RepID=A0AAX2H0D6_9FLAO|nr:transglycosylase domain-containing protein [Capnocytophaga haemolytica]AMD84432.1 penicillin-binding protein [Capnocytophaga haemolytica]SFO09762.1 penicillin-binding protein 1A [Capnocytophaga haemolytica]SNV10586.1 Penicillin-binding protein 1A [Capnocytophaga haemolytica]
MKSFFENITFKELVHKVVFGIAHFFSRLLSWLIKAGEYLYKWLRVGLKYLAQGVLLVVLIVPFFVYDLYQRFSQRDKSASLSSKMPEGFWGKVLKVLYTPVEFLIWAGKGLWQWLRSKTYKFYLKWIGIPIGVGVAAVAVLFALVYFGCFGELPTEEDLQDLRQSESSLVYDYEGQILGKFYILDRTRIEYDDFPPYLIKALVSTEDERFFQHGGVDVRSLFRVFFKTLLLQDDSSGGGSTITMQLAKNIFGRGKRYGKLSMPIHKIREMIIAKRFEKAYTKEEIITLYLNTVPFSDNTYGIESAAQHFFDKSASELTLNEAATLIGSLKATSSYNPRTAPERSRERRDVVLNQMKKNNVLTEADYKLHKKDTVKVVRTAGEVENLAPYMLEQIRLQLPTLLKDVKKKDGSSYNIYRDGLRIYTTVDKTMQKYAENAVKQHLPILQKEFEQLYGNKAPWNLDSDWFKQEVKKLPLYKELEDKGLSEAQIWAKLSEKRPMDLSFYQRDSVMKHSTLDSISQMIRMLNTGFLTVDPQTGGIRSYVGGANFQYFKYDHVLQSRRQVGSVFKPIVYATALEQGLPACSHFSPRTLTYPDKGGWWTPGNASRTEEDPYVYYSVAKALRESLNTVAVQVLFYAGLQNVIKKAQMMGITSPLPRVPSIALGSADLSVIEMARAYTTFANKGVPVKPYFIEKITNKRGEVIWEYKHPPKAAQALNETTTQTMLQYLRGTVNQGTAARMRGTYGLTNDLAGKTGTTQDNKDGWFAGMLPNLVMVTWVGNDQQIGFRSTRVGQGANSALPIAAIFVQQLNKNPKYKELTKAYFQVSNDIQTTLRECEPVVRDDFFDRLLSSTPKDTIRSGELPYRIYESSGRKLHNVDEEEEISIEDVTNPTPASSEAKPASNPEGQEDQGKKKGFLNRIFNNNNNH